MTKLIGIPLGCLGGWWLGTVGLVILVIVLLVSLANPTSLIGVGSGGNNARLTQEFAGKQNTAVVNAARTLVSFLYACGDGHYNCYRASFPATVLGYLNDACGNPHCPYAQSGNFQCVFFVLAAYYFAGQTLPAGPDAVKFWGAYQNYQSFLEIPANGAPEPGDMAVFSGPLSGPFANPAGHIAIIIDVAVPGKSGTGGYIQLAQANGLKAIEDLPLTQTNPGQPHPIWQVTAWPGYTLLGYIRNAA